MTAPPLRFRPDGLGWDGDILWVADYFRSLMAGVATSTGLVVSVVDTIAPVTPCAQRGTARIVVGGDHLWAATPAGLFVAQRDGSAGSILDVGGGVSDLAAGPDAVWATVWPGAWQAELVRIDLADHHVTRLPLQDRTEALVAGAEGAWLVHGGDHLLSAVAPDVGGVVDRARLPGSLYGFGLGQEVVVAVVAVPRGRARGNGVICGVLRFDRASGQLIGVTRREGLCKALLVDGYHAWMQTRADAHVHPHDGTPLSATESVIERIDLDDGEVVEWLTISTAGVHALAGSQSEMWAGGFSYEAQFPWVARVDLRDGTVAPPVDFSVIDVTGFTQRVRTRRSAPDVPPERPPATTPAEVEQRALAALNDAVLNPLQSYDGKGNKLPLRPRMPGFDFEPVRLADSYPRTRAQFVFRSDQHADCRYGLDRRLWDDDGRWAAAGWGEWAGLPDPEEAAFQLVARVDEALHTRTVLPDRCHPDGEGITWVTDPSYYGKARADWTFEESVEAALNKNWPSRRPYSREAVENLLPGGMASADDLAAAIETGASADADIALWLLHAIGDARAAELLLSRLDTGDETTRRHAAERLASIARPEDEARLGQRFLAEADPTTRANLLRTLGVIGDEATRHLAATTLRDQREDPAVRAAAASTLGVLTIGEPDDIAALAAATRSPHPAVAAAATNALRRFAPPPPEHSRDQA